MSDHTHEWIVFTGQGEDYVGCWACGAKRSCHDHIVTLEAKVEKLEEELAVFKSLDYVWGLCMVEPEETL